MGILLPATVALLVSASSDAPRVFDLGGRTTVSELTAGVWLVTSVSDLPGFGAVSSNALLVEGPEGSLLIDAPATNDQTAKVLAFAEKVRKKPVLGAIGTHAHVDRIGGFGACHASGIPTYALAQTRKLALEGGLPQPQREVTSGETLKVAGIPCQVRWLGAGHTPDNGVVWLPVQHVLFGGCLVKEMQARTPGNLAEADLAGWLQVMDRLVAEFSKAPWVIPGHGAPGDGQLLSHTRTLVLAARGASPR